MNPYAILGVLLAFAGLGSWATYESGQASKWRGQYDSLKASYQTAAQQAKDDAAKLEKEQMDDLDRQSKAAIDDARDSELEAEQEKRIYEAKLAALAKSKPTDLPHACAGQPIPADLIP